MEFTHKYNVLYCCIQSDFFYIKFQYNTSSWNNNNNKHSSIPYVY